MARPIWSKIFWTLASLGALWAILIGSLLNPTIQRHALYAHRINTVAFQDIDKPEIFGFEQGQVDVLRIMTTDQESLYAWLVHPLSSYSKQEYRENGNASEWAFTLNREVECRLVISFHGNAGHVAQGWRSGAYKLLSTANQHVCTYVLAFDYRGFGKSTGSPSEEGLITDGMAVTRYASEKLNFAPKNIVLLGHSLGTAVVAAVADRWVAEGNEFEFAGVCLVASFSDIPSLMKTYAIGGLIPILSPLSGYPRLHGMISKYFVDTWNTSERLTRLAGKTSNLRLHIFHARDDFDIGWKHSDLLFDAAAAGLRNTDMSMIQTPERQFGSTRVKAIVGPESSSEDITTNDFFVKRTLLRHGGHNSLLQHAPIAIAIDRIFSLSKIGR